MLTMAPVVLAYMHTVKHDCFTTVIHNDCVASHDCFTTVIHDDCVASHDCFMRAHLVHTW